MRNFILLFGLLLTACNAPSTQPMCNTTPDGGTPATPTRTCVARVTEFAGSSVTLFQEQLTSATDSQLRVSIHSCEYRTQIPTGGASFTGVGSWAKGSTASCQLLAGDFTGGANLLERLQGASAVHATFSDSASDGSFSFDADVTCIETSP